MVKNKNQLRKQFWEVSMLELSAYINYVDTDRGEAGSGAAPALALHCFGMFCIVLP